MHNSHLKGESTIMMVIGTKIGTGLIFYMQLRKVVMEEVTYLVALKGERIVYTSGNRGR